MLDDAVRNALRHVESATGAVIRKPLMVTRRRDPAAKGESMKTFTSNLATLGCIVLGPALAGTHATPFSASVEFGFGGTPLPPTAECPIIHQSAGTGFATHLGILQTIGVTCGFNAHVEQNPDFNPGGAPPFMVADFVREATWTAANGDQLFVTMSGVFVQSLSDSSSGLLAALEIDGGTGRFTGSDGSASAFRYSSDTAISVYGQLVYAASQASIR